jgi:hypothetical protein
MCRILEEKGKPWRIRTFLDEKDIESGDSIPESIRKKIIECKEFVVLLTRNSVNRPWVLLETGAAWGRRKRITAIVDKIAVNEMPDIVAPLKAIDLNDFDDYVSQMIVRARKARKSP